MMQVCEFDFELFNADEKVSSLDQFWSYMNKEDTLTFFLVLETQLLQMSFVLCHTYTTEILYIGI